MKLLKILLLVGAFLATFAPAQGQGKDWTLLVYMIGSDLESGGDFGSGDIAEMVAGATNTDYVNVVLLRGGSTKPGWTTPSSYLVANGQVTSLPFVPTNVSNMANPTSITEFINYGIQNYPAQSYGLVFWNHGSGIQGYGYDNQSNKQLTVPQIAQAIGNSSFIQNSNKFDFIGFDACLMGNLEVQFTLRDYAFYFVGSEELEPGHGWNYTPIVQGMESGNALYGDEMGIIIVNGFRQQADAQGNTDITLSVTDLFYAAEMEAKIQALITKIQTDGKVKKLQRARARSEEYGKSLSTPAVSSDVADVGDMMKKLKALDPSLAPEADSVLAVLAKMVVYNTKGSHRPNATGLSMYLPHEVLVSQGETDYVIYEVYDSLAIPASLKNFVKNTYVPIAQGDNTAPNGSLSTFSFKKSGGDGVSAIQIEHDDDLEQVQIVLDEAFVGGTPTQFILLGSTVADTVVINPDGTEIYAYKWDEEWIGIDGIPAYVADIHEFQEEDSMGNITHFTRIHIPALLNPGTAGEKDIMISFRYDDQFNYVLESIVPEIFGDTFRVAPKERIKLQPGDQVQLVYEIFDEATDEEYFWPGPNAIINITTGNSDLMLEHDRLEPGDYHIGFHLMDHSRNDTIIFDTTTYTVSASAIEENFAAYNIGLYPNPAQESVTLEYPDFAGAGYTVRIMDIQGRTLIQKTLRSHTNRIETGDLPSGIYGIELIDGDKIRRDKLVIRR